MSIFNFVKTASISCIAIVGCSLTSIAQAVSPNDIKLIYSASQIQCGPGNPLINVKVDVFSNGQFVKTLSLGDSIYLTLNSSDQLNIKQKKEKFLEQLTFHYSFVNSKCSPTTPTEMVLSHKDQVPNLAGAYDQDSIEQMLKKLKGNHKELLLVELGTTNKSSTAYDLQDTIMHINYLPYCD